MKKTVCFTCPRPKRLCGYHRVESSIKQQGSKTSNIVTLQVQIKIYRNRLYRRPPVCVGIL